MSRGRQIDYSVYYAGGTHIFKNDVTAEETYDWLISRGGKKVPKAGTLKHFVQVKKLLHRPDLLNALMHHARNNDPVFAQVAADYMGLNVNIEDELQKKLEEANKSTLFTDDEKEALRNNLDIAISQLEIKDKCIAALEAENREYKLRFEEMRNLLDFN